MNILEEREHRLLPLDEKEYKHLEGYRRLVRSELNIERWSSMFATSQFKGRSRKIYRKLKDNRIIGVIVGLQKDSRGRPIEVDVLRVPALKAFYGLVRLWELVGKPAEQLVVCTLPQLRRLLGKGLGGKEYADLKRVIESLHHIPIKWIGSFYQKDTDTLETIEDGFHILSTLKFFEQRVSGHLTAAAMAYKFHDRILRNLLNHYTKPVQLEVIVGFRRELAVLLYCHVDLILADKERYERRTKELFEDLAIEGSKYKYPAARRQNLEPALKELVGVKLSTGILKQAYLEKAADSKDWKAVFIKKPFESPSRQREDLLEVQALVEDILSVTGDEKSRGFYTKLAKLALVKPKLRDLVYRCLSEVKDEWYQGLIRKSKGAAFTDKIKRYCKERGIDLGLKAS